MAIARGLSPGLRRIFVLPLVAVLAIVAAAPAPLRALDTAPLGSDLRLERLASQRTAAFAPESRQVKLPALTHAALPGKCSLPSPALKVLAVVAEYAPAPGGLTPGGASCRAPPVVIPS